MARIIPDINPETIANSGERRVYVCMKQQLPDDWVVRYHYPVCWQEGSYLRDREGDFVVIAPEHGILFVEVKGSSGYEVRAGTWYRIDDSGQETRMERSPFDQVTAFAHAVTERLAGKLGSSKSAFPGIYGHVVMYPRARICGPLPASIDADALITAHRMEKLRETFVGLFRKWGSEKRGREFAGQIVKRTISFFSDECRFIPVLTRDADEDDARIEQMTQRQWKVFKGILANPRVLVEGTAGSGKTMLACWTAAQRKQAGQRVLLLCFNKSLAEWLRSTICNREELGYEILHYHAWIAGLCREIGIQAAGGWSEDDWDNRRIDASLHALEQRTSDQQYDSIIVDEAQDFKTDWWLPILSALRDPDHGGLALFMDAHQAGVYGNLDDVPDGCVRFRLEENCRNGVKIARYAGNILQKRLPTLEGAPEGGVEIAGVAYPSVKERAMAARQQVVAWMNEGISACDIAVISPWAATNAHSSLSLLGTIHNKPCQIGHQYIQDWLNNDCLFASTIKSFKGMEARYILLVDAPMPGVTGFDTADLFVAATRAKLKLKIIAESQESLNYMNELLLKC